MDYQKILDQLISGQLKEYRVEAKDAFGFQEALRNFGKRQDITGRAERGGSIIYTSSNSK
jgi:hypothetical protein